MTAEEAKQSMKNGDYIKIKGAPWNQAGQITCLSDDESTVYYRYCPPGEACGFFRGSAAVNDIELAWPSSKGAA